MPWFLNLWIRLSEYTFINLFLIKVNKRGAGVWETCYNEGQEIEDGEKTTIRNSLGSWECTCMKGIWLLSACTRIGGNSQSQGNNPKNAPPPATQPPTQPPQPPTKPPKKGRGKNNKKPKNSRKTREILVRTRSWLAPPLHVIVWMYVVCCRIFVSVPTMWVREKKKKRNRETEMHSR